MAHVVMEAGKDNWTQALATLSVQWERLSHQFEVGRSPHVDVDLLDVKMG